MWRWPIPTLILIVVAAGCSGDDSDPVFTADEVTAPTAAPTTQLIVPLTTVPPITERSIVVFDRLTVLEENVVEIAGTGGASTDQVTIDGAVAAFLTFELTADDAFIATVPIDSPGNHTICVATTCDTVDVGASTE